MNEFERRWKQAAAHSAKPAGADVAPFGFATRVVAKWRAQPSLATIWHRLALRFCTGVAIVVAVLASSQVLTADDADVLRPNIESVVDELFWALR
jgi:uncharacterized RDD family membrane protein YckC